MAEATGWTSQGRHQKYTTEARLGHVPYADGWTHHLHFDPDPIATRLNDIGIPTERSGSPVERPVSVEITWQEEPHVHLVRSKTFHWKP